jgi:hypothetical protein
MSNKNNTTKYYKIQIEFKSVFKSLMKRENQERKSREKIKRENQERNSRV